MTRREFLFGCRRWTEAEDATLRAALDAPGRPSIWALAQSLAPTLERTAAAVDDRLRMMLRARHPRPSRAGQDSKPRHARPAAITRRCLGCRSPFQARSPFIRVCDPCKTTAVWRAGA